MDHRQYQDHNHNNIDYHQHHCHYKSGYRLLCCRQINVVITNVHKSATSRHFRQFSIFQNIFFKFTYVAGNLMLSSTS